MSVNLEAMELRKRLATEREQGAREERARIVAWLRDDMRNFDGSKLMSVDDAGDIIADAIERGEYEEKANG